MDIPEFQRDFVWDAEKVKLLAESLYRNYPVGSFLFWDSSEYQEPKTAQGTQQSVWIVDGQQRVTAVCLLFGQKPYWWSDTESWNRALERYDVMVNLFPDQGDEYLEFALINPVRRRDPRWCSIREVLSKEKVEDLTDLAQDIAAKISDDRSAIMGPFGQIHARLSTLWQIRERVIPVIKITHEVEDVAEIFARLNQAGTRVKEADVVLALTAVRNPGWVREEYLPFRNELEDRGWDLPAGIFIRTMTGIGVGRARLKEVPDSFWSAERLPSAWKKTRETISEVLKRLAEFGITSADLLPSTNSLIPLFVLHHWWRRKADYRFERALHWFLLANWGGRYSGSAITSLNEDVRAVVAATEFRQALDSLRGRLRVPPAIDEDEFLNRYDRAGSRFLRLMLYLVIFQRGARDWVDKTRIGYDKTDVPITTGFEPQWHHIYPRNVLKKAGISDDQINALASITVLNERTNVRKLGSKPPGQYLKQFGISAEVLRGHLIPEPFDNPVRAEVWDVKTYDVFLLKRAQLLAQEATAFLKRLEGA